MLSGNDSDLAALVRNNGWGCTDRAETGSLIVNILISSLEQANKLLDDHRNGATRAIWRSYLNLRNINPRSINLELDEGKVHEISRFYSAGKNT